MTPQRLLIAAPLLILSASCSRTAPPREVHAQNEQAVGVSAVKAEPRALAREMTITAQFRPWQEVDVHAKVAGYLRRINVDVGDRVAAGQVIGTLEVPELGEDLAYASATQRRTEKDVERARSEVTRAESNVRIRELSWKRLSDVAKARPGLIAQQEVDDANARFREAQAQLTAAQAALAASQEQVQVSAANRSKVRTIINYLRVTAPFAGVITRRYADTGAMIQAGTASQTQAMPVVRVAQDDRLRLVLPVPESIVPRVRVGTAIEIRVESLKRVLQAKVSRFSGQVDAATRTMTTEVDVANPDRVLKPGMIAHATIRTDQREAALAIPVQAVRDSGSSKTALVVTGENRVEERPLTTGVETAYFVEVLKGVSLGESVIVGTRVPLRPGQLVAAKFVAPPEEVVQ